MEMKYKTLNELKEALDVAPRSKLRRIGAKLRRSQPVFALESFDAVRLTIHPSSKL